MDSKAIEKECEDCIHADDDIYNPLVCAKCKDGFIAGAAFGRSQVVEEIITLLNKKMFVVWIQPEHCKGEDDCIVMDKDAVLKELDELSNNKNKDVK